MGAKFYSLASCSQYGSKFSFCESILVPFTSLGVQSQAELLATTFFCIQSSASLQLLPSSLLLVFVLFLAHSDLCLVFEPSGAFRFSSLILYQSLLCVQNRESDQSLNSMLQLDLNARGIDFFTKLCSCSTEYYTYQSFKQIILTTNIKAQL